MWLGFCCGVVAFTASFAGLEVVARRIFLLGGVKEGVGNGLFWVLFKFFVPLTLVYYGNLRGFSIFGIFAGFLFGLGNICLVLYREGAEERKFGR